MHEQYLRWMHQDIGCIIRMISKNYVELLKNPDFKHEEFVLTGGFQVLGIYKMLLDSCKNTGCDLDIDLHMSYHNRIQDIYNKRWEINND